MGGDWGDVRGLGEESRALRHAAFLAAFGPLATLAGVGRWGVGGMRRFAACRVSCGLRAARNACAVREAGAWGHAALCNLPRFLRPLGRSQRLREGALGRGGMPRFAACRVSCGLWAACNACAYCAAAQGFGALPQTPAGAQGSVCPVGTWAEGPKRPEAHRREASALWAVARSAKRPAGVSKYKGCARQRTERRYLRRQRNHERAGGKRQPCGLLREAQSDPQA